MPTDTERNEKPAPKPISSGLAFSGVCNVRNTEAHLRWLGAQLSFFLNLPAWAGIAFRLTSEPKNPELLILVGGGLFFAAANYFLYEVIKRDSRHLDLWNDKLDELERVNGIEGGTEVFSSRRYRRLRGSRQRLQARLQYAMVGSTVMWVLFAIVAAVMLVRGTLS